jgi:hypothetical protein
MREDLHRELTAKLKADYGFEEKGTYLRKGKCPQCSRGQRELFAHAASPWVLKCGREDKCGWQGHVKDLYPEIFDDWSKRHKQTPQRPNAAADAYLTDARGFDIVPLNGAYTQEYYRDQELGIGTATVRFPLPGGTFWERLIDQPGRFGKKKARFGYGGSYKGQWWMLPGVSMEDLARSREIWLAEGIFDAVALNQSARLAAVSLMSCNNWPEKALEELRRAAADLGLPLPRLVFAFDVGAAGTRWTRRFVQDARAKGWDAVAAQVRVDGDATDGKLDWNDLAQRDLLTPAHIAEYRWNGDVTTAGSAAEKANLIYQKTKSASFPLVFGGRQLWATFSIDRIQALHAEWLESTDSEFDKYKTLPFEEQWNLAAAKAVDIEELANCTFQTLYFQRDTGLDEGAYFFRVDFPSDRPTVKATFSGSACTAGAEFKKRLASIAPGAQFTGTTQQLDKLMQRQWSRIRMVEAIQFTGYSIDHGAYILGDIAVHNGVVHRPNEEEYFVLGKQSVKLRTSDRLLRIDYDPEKLNLDWLPHLLTAYGAKGTITLTYFIASLFAEQIRREQSSFGFLEMSGPPGTGKTTLLEFLWKLVGRANYEGFNPTKSTKAGRARNFGQVANLPVVLIEGDRGAETPHAAKFEWDELKDAYNGRPVYTRGVANGGMETFEPPFRASLIIAQNATVEGSDAMHERIMGLHFDKARFGPAGKAAGEALSAVPLEEVSGFIIHVLRHEAKILEYYRAAFKRHEASMLAREAVRNGRLAKNHAQLAAMLDAVRPLFGDKLPQREVDDAHALLIEILEERQRATEREHANVEWFWERFDWFAARDAELQTAPSNPINHSRAADVIAVSLVDFERRCGDANLRLPCTMKDLKRDLKTSKARKFLEASKATCSITGKTVNCWHFRNPTTSPTR